MPALRVAEVGAKSEALPSFWDDRLSDAFRHVTQLVGEIMVCIWLLEAAVLQASSHV